MQDLAKILNLAFLPEDTVCASNSKYGYHSVPISSVLSGEITLVSPNSGIPNRTIKTEQLTMLAINPIKGFRLDENVYRHQNFMWELDIGSLSSQLQYVRALNLPYSASIFSGNKSIHFLTCLDQEIDLKTYRLLYLWALNIGTLFDQSCKNPSRSIRIPGNVRPDTGKKQRLVELKDKVKLDDFLNWLNKYPDLRPKEREKKNVLTDGYDFDKLSPWLKKELKNGIDFSQGRNARWYAIFCDFALAGYSEIEAIEILTNYFVEEHDFKEKEWLVTAESAYKNMARN
jgi:hypothetical protein